MVNKIKLINNYKLLARLYALTVKKENVLGGEGTIVKNPPFPARKERI